MHQDLHSNKHHLCIGNVSPGPPTSSSSVAESAHSSPSRARNSIQVVGLSFRLRGSRWSVPTKATAANPGGNALTEVVIHAADADAVVASVSLNTQVCVHRISVKKTGKRRIFHLKVIPSRLGQPQPKSKCKTYAAPKSSCD